MGYEKATSKDTNILATLVREFSVREREEGGITMIEV